MMHIELATEAWKAWIKNKPSQSEDTAKGFMAGFNFCLLGKLKIEGGDKGELINTNIFLQDKLAEARAIIRDLLSVLPQENIEGIYEIAEEAEQFLEEVK